MCTFHNCVVCGNTVEEFEAVRVTQANRASHDNEGAAFICLECANDTAPRKTRNKAERGAETVTELEYRITFTCNYSVQARAEFAKSKWLACEGAIKSPKYANMKWQRKLETLDTLLSSGDIEMTGDTYVSVIRHGSVLECTATEYTNKAEFLAFIRVLVDEHKARIYKELYGKSFHYGKLNK